MTRPEPACPTDAALADAHELIARIESATSSQDVVALASLDADVRACARALVASARASRQRDPAGPHCAAALQALRDAQRRALDACSEARATALGSLRRIDGSRRAVLQYAGTARITG